MTKIWRNDRIPNEIFGSNIGSFDHNADQTTSGYVNAPINNHIITTLGFSQILENEIFIKMKDNDRKILESRELRETRQRRGWRRQWRWRYWWQRRCKGRPLQGRGPTCPNMLLCLIFRSNLIWFDSIWFDLLLYIKIRKCDLISESLYLCLLPPSRFPISSLWDSGDTSIGLKCLTCCSSLT